jgi:hypothetical protein
MNIIKIEKGKVELYQDDGSFINTIGNGNAFHADIDKYGYLILITTTRGRVELYKKSGSFIRNIGDGNALLAKFRRNNILITTYKHKFEIRKVNGELIEIF